jgi:hypothetical protein
MSPPAPVSPSPVDARENVDYGDQVAKLHVPALLRSELAVLILCALSNQV